MNMRWVVMRGTSHHKFQTWKASSLSRLDYPHLFIEVITARFVHAFVTFNYLSFYCVGGNQRKPKQTCRDSEFGDDGTLHIDTVVSHFERAVASLAFFVTRRWVEHCLQAMTSSQEDIWEDEQTVRACDFLSTQKLRSNECVWTSRNPFYVQLSGNRVAPCHR